MDRDIRGRRRRPEQERGLRPLHPLLPEAWDSRAVRLAMSAGDWARFESLALAAAAESPTHARACGLVISRLMRESGRPESKPAIADWMEWERQKALKLLRPTV